ncbi:hypothetical protein DL98DRAFT_527476 [Cadophora sp. DSE1049]|nr:hypothetical protein DL98DRAFT_527476 [Cadophora sp. DSE1049]
MASQPAHGPNGTHIQVNTALEMPNQLTMPTPTIAGAALELVDQTEAVIELRSILERLQMKQDLAVPDLLQMSSTPAATLSFIVRVPLHIRIKIYEFALVNPFLSDPESIHPRRSQFGASVQYDLSPAILRVCKQIYNEASEVLYGKNVFVVSGLGHIWDYSPWPKLVECPLSRYLHLGPPEPLYLEFARSSPVQKVRNWKLVVSADASIHRPQLATRDLVRLIVDSPPLASFAVFAMSQNMSHRFPMPVQLAPIRMLRNVSKVHFEDPGHSIIIDLQLELKLAAQSSGHAQHVFKMYTRLLFYAQAFERSEHSRFSMEMPRWCDRSEFASQSRESVRPRNQSAMNVNRHPHSYLNVFKTITPHPVEAALELAKFASDENDFGAFKVQRRLITDFLEPQYQRIAAANDLWTSFVKEHETVSGILGTPSELLRPESYHSSSHSDPSGDDTVGTLCRSL